QRGFTAGTRAVVGQRTGPLRPRLCALTGDLFDVLRCALGHLSVRGWSRGVWRLKFCRHKPTSSSAVPYENSLARLEFGETPAAERLHMHEYVGRFRAAREKAKPA